MPEVFVCVVEESEDDTNGEVFSPEGSSPGDNRVDLVQLLVSGEAVAFEVETRQVQASAMGDSETATDAHLCDRETILSEPHRHG